MGLFKEDIKKRPLASQAWARVVDEMRTHVMGKPPTWLFKTRRPLESTNEYALTYREENFQPISKQSFLQAISAILESANHIHVQVEGVDDNTKAFLEDFTTRVAGKTYSHKDYIVNFVGRAVEVDPNAVLVHLPVHPSEPLIPDYREDLPNFDNIINQFVDINIELIPSEWIQLIDEDELWYNAGEWLYDIDNKQEKYAPYYFLLTKEATRIAIPYKTNEGVDYRIEDYYANNLENVPYDIIGDNRILEDVDGETVELHDVTYSGAVAIGNEMLGVHSDSGIINTRFTYPEKYMHVERCGHPQAIECSDPKSPYFGLHVIYDFTDETSPSCTVCTSCNGTGNAQPDTSPLGTHFVAKSDVFDESGKFTPLIGFVHPDLGAPAYMSEQVEKLFARMERALFIMSQNMTNQSGESKSYDVRQKISTISRAVTNIYSIYEKSLNTIQGFFRGTEDIIVQLPTDFNIKNSADVTMELAESRNTSSVYTSQLTNELLIKKFGNNPTTRRMVEFLELQDKVWGFTMKEILEYKAVTGNGYTIRDQVIHDKGWAVLKKIAQSEDFLTISDDELLTRFNDSINVLAPVVIEPSPIAP